MDAGWAGREAYTAPTLHSKAAAPDTSADNDGPQGLLRQRFARAKGIFCDAIDHPAEGRAAFVATACGCDAGLLREVESLLVSDGQADSFIEVPAAALLGTAKATNGTPHGRPEPSPALQAGARLGKYLIEGLLGSGGMGEVYRARDMRLRREVAIKIVKSDQADDVARAGLLREARHASLLNHPGICTVHEVGTAAGRPYIVMERVDGETLREAVVRAGRLPPDLVLRYGARIAAALAHAHQRGVVHRDLKSTNVMVGGENCLKVLDFGLARRLPEFADAEASSSFGAHSPALAGTVPYMAPEVLLGGAADGRSDIWSLGVLLFEMAAGELPFRGQSAFETASAVLRIGLPPLPRGVPLGLRLVIGRCLARDPGERYQRAADVLAALLALQGGGRRRLTARLLLAQPRPGVSVRVAFALAAVIVLVTGLWWTRHHGDAAPRVIRTVAVLPLENVAGGNAEPYFADGITEALIDEVGETGVERVISRTTAMAFRGARQPLAEVARELGVDAIVDGSVTRTADRVRLSVRLRDGPSGRVLWSASEERDTREVLALLSEVARGIATGLNHPVTEAAAGRLATVRAVDPVVYEAYLKGRYHWNARTEGSLRRAVEYYQAAIGLDATYAPAHAALADCYNQLGTVLVGTGSPQDLRPLAAASAIKALQLDPNLAEGNATLGYIKHYEWEWEEAERAFLRAIRLNPSNALAHIWYANLLASRRRFPEALREVQRAQDLDPFSLVVNTNVAWTLRYAGREEEAIAQLRHTLGLDPSYVQAHLRLASALAATGRFDAAIEESQMAIHLTGESPSSLASLADVAARSGRHAEARALLDRLLVESKTRYVSPASIAGIHEQLGDIDAAFEWLEKAYHERSNHIAYLAADGHARLKPDPRFGALLRRVGLGDLP